VYVLGGLTDDFKQQGHVKDQLIGMCMRCVSGLRGIMAPNATVTILPANDGRASIGLRETHDMAHVKVGEAWQVPYAALVEPSAIRFDDAIKAQEKQAFETLCTHDDATTAPAPLAESDKPLTPEEINAFMASHMKCELGHSRGRIDSVAMTVIEVKQGNHYRYEYSFEPTGPEYNALIAPVSRAATLSRPIPKTADDAHINRIFFTGYHADGSDYICNPEQWDRAIKRTLVGKMPSVEFIPLNDGTYPQTDVITKPLDTLVPTHFRGSKQPDGCCR
jgi:hypothetical protein